MLGEDQEHKKENKNIPFTPYLKMGRRELAEFWEETQGERKKKHRRNIR